MKEIKYYMCEYCNCLDDQTTIIDHEKYCESNPKNKTCITCSNYNDMCFCKVIKQAIIYEVHTNCKDWSSNNDKV